MESKFVPIWNIYWKLPIEVSEEGSSKVTTNNDEHSLNALFPIEIIDLGIIILLNDVHLLNAFEPVEVIKSRFTNWCY